MGRSPVKEIRYSPAFESDLAKLARRHRHLPGRVEAELAAIASGQTATARRIPGLDGAPVFKQRLPVDGRGKRGGARLIYYDTDVLVLALCIYVKADHANVPNAEVRQALSAAGIESPRPEQLTRRGRPGHKDANCSGR